MTASSTGTRRASRRTGIQPRVARPAMMSRVEREETLVDVSCVVHLHTTYSDGTATVGEVVAAARAAGVDLVLLTDHDSVEARRDGWDGRHDGVFVLVGTEVSPKRGHYLAFGVDREITHTG